MDFLRIENITAGYDDKSIIENISFTMNRGELTGLLGLNGTGKTTLFKTIGGLLKPTNGKFLIDGKDSFQLREKERAKRISYMSQRSSIIYNTLAIDVVLMGITPYLSLFETPNKEHKSLAYEMIKIMGMEKFAYSSFLTLSEGQKQLIIIARNLMQNSDVMLFDEPDSALDFKNKHMVLDKIRNVIKEKNRCGIITLHDPNFALSYCDRIIVIHNGKILSNFIPHKVDIVQLKETFSYIYGEIEVIEYKNKYFIVR